MFPEQIIYHLDEIDGKTAPLKLNGDVIHNGINAKFTPLILNIEDDTASVLVFTDGSQKKSNIVPPEVAAGAAWLVRLRFSKGALPQINEGYQKVGLNASRPLRTTK